MRIKFSRTYLALVLALGCTSSALASNYFLKLDTQLTNEADIKGTNSNVQNSSFGFILGGSYNDIDYSVEYKRSEYDFSGSYEPFDALNKIAFDFSQDVSLSSHLQLYYGLNLGALFESSLALSDSYSVSPRAALGWNFYSNMTAYLGAYANFNAADNVFLPIVGLKIGNNSDMGWTGSIAYPETKLQYRFNRSLSADITYLTVRDTYYIDSSYGDAYFREESQGASIGATYNFTPKMHLSGGVFGYFDRELKFYNGSGDEIGTLDVDNNVGAYARFTFAF